jgi:aconitate hydratase
MSYPFDRDKAIEILTAKRKLLARGLSYAEKILFLHEGKRTSAQVLTRGVDQIELYPDRVAMQDATAQMAMLQFIQAGQKKTRVTATIHCDHLLMARDGAKPDLSHAQEMNKEVYDFLSSAAQKYGIGFWGPGSGIIHQVLLENYALPGTMMIGTDSHTPNAGGLGMIAIGVGGADAAEVMAGLYWETINPLIVGVRLIGSLQGWASAKDVILEMLRRFTVKGGTGKIFEYFGPGAQTLSATEKATITNMGAELGATSSVFVYDESMDAYMRNVGREKDADFVRSMADILSQDDICLTEPHKVFDEVVEINLNDVTPNHAGPFSPDRVTRVRDFDALVKKKNWPRTVSYVLLGSCTNSSYADLYAASQVLEQAEEHGLKAKVPFMLSPGSTQTYETIKRDGILDKIIAAGSTILSCSCGPCIGQWDRKEITPTEENIIFTTFNRNFRGRNDGNPNTLAFLTSPQMAASIALSGDPGFNPETDELISSDGVAFKLTPPSPPPLSKEGLSQYRESYIPPEEGDSDVELKVNPRSERLELLEPFKKWDGKDFMNLPVLVKTKGKTTTDHISPGGKWLKFRGHLTNISENLLAGAVNAFTSEAGHGTNVLTSEKHVRFADLAKAYKEAGTGSVIIGDENYGEGSSREHAAMSPRFLGVKVVAARSFARIHEANLKKQGIVPLTFAQAEDYNKIEEFDRVSLLGLNDMTLGKEIKSIVSKQDGSTIEIMFNHTMTEEQIEWFKAGSALNLLSDTSN